MILEASSSLCDQICILLNIVPFRYSPSVLKALDNPVGSRHDPKDILNIWDRKGDAIDLLSSLTNVFLHIFREVTR